MTTTDQGTGAGPWRPRGVHSEIVSEKEDFRNLQAAERPRFTGARWKLFWLVLVRAMITIVTLGVGRFWMITRIRRHFWSSIEIAGAPLEYTGTAVEKLIGFLIAVVILAIYLVVVNLGLAFVGLSYFQGNPLALQLPLLALLPFIPWAQYRARRYILARTRWRGIRFGMDPGAWGYALRATFWWFLTLITLGLLYPLKQMKLARYATNRSYFGDLRFEQQGSWVELLKSWLWVWLPIPLLMIAGGLWAASYVGGIEDVFGDIGGDGDGGRVNKPDDGGLDVDDPMIGLVFGAVTSLGYLWVLFFSIRHQVFSFRYLNSRKVLGGRTWFDFKLGVWPVVGIYVIGGMVIQIGILIFAILGIAVALAVIAGFGLDYEMLLPVLEGEPPDMSGMLVLGIFLAAYLPAIASTIALNQAFISHPLVSEACFTTRIHGLEHVGRARQRAHDRQAEAGGFADALGADIGAAF